LLQLLVVMLGVNAWVKLGQCLDNVQHM